MLRAIGRRLTYANVIASLALFLALGGGAVWAASHRQGNKVGTGRLKPNAVTAGKIKPNAVTTSKIRDNAVTNSKLREGAVDYAKLAVGTNVVATATSYSTAVDGASAVGVGFPTPISFTPVAGSVYLMSVEARSTNLARSGTEPCRVTITPLVNGSEWGTAAPLVLSAFQPTPEAPAGGRPGGRRDEPDRPRCDRLDADDRRQAGRRATLRVVGLGHRRGRRHPGEMIDGRRATAAASPPDPPAHRAGDPASLTFRK